MALKKKEFSRLYQITNEELKEKFKEAILSNEDIATYDDYKRISKYNRNMPNPSLIERRLGSYGNVIKELGLLDTINERKIKYGNRIVDFSNEKFYKEDMDYFIEFVKTLIPEDTNKMLYVDEYKNIINSLKFDFHVPSYTILIKYFGSWEEVSKRCGVKIAKKNKKPVWNEENVIDAIQRIFGKNFRFRNFTHYMDERKPCYIHQLPARKIMTRIFTNVENLNKKLDEASRNKR